MHMPSILKLLTSHEAALPLQPITLRQSCTCCMPDTVASSGLTRFFNPKTRLGGGPDTVWYGTSFGHYNNLRSLSPWPAE